MDGVIETIIVMVLLMLIILGSFFLVSPLIEGIKNAIEDRRIKKNPNALTAYPYLPLDMVTKHFGWSYEYERYHGWNYFIWLVRDDGTTISVNSFNNGSRTTAIEDCRKLEEYFYGKEPDKHAGKILGEDSTC